MSLKDTIEKAAHVVGSQRALAALIGQPEQSISGFKAGTRVCGLKLRIKIAEIAGVDRVRTIFEYFVDSLDDKDAYEHTAKEALQAMLNAFPPETDEAPESKKPLRAQSSQGLSWRKRKFPSPPTTRHAGFFYAYFKLECPGLLTRYKARLTADSDTSCSRANARMVYCPVK